MSIEDKEKKYKKKIRKNDEYRVIYESIEDCIIVRKRTKFWVHILSIDQWNKIKDNISKKIFYLSSNVFKDISEGDILLMYVRINNTKTGFMGIGQTDSKMYENKKNIVVHDDTNHNKYIVELDVLSSFQDMCKLNTISEVLQKMDTPIKTTNKFSTEFLRGLCVFNEITNKDLGLEIIKALIKYTSKQDESLESTFLTYISDMVNGMRDIDNASSYYSDYDSDDDFNKSYIRINIPIMVNICRSLRQQIKRLKKDKNQIIRLILDHYMCCRRCHITNNNNTELLGTLNGVDINDIVYMDTNYDDCLKAYINLEPYISDDKMREMPKITIYYLKKNEIYKEDILIAFSSEIRSKYMKIEMSKSIKDG